MRLVAFVVGLVVLSGCADESARPVLGPPPETVAGQAAPTTTGVDATAGLIPLDGFDVATLRVINGTETTELPVLLADTIERRRQGLMGVTDLGEFAGMVFVFDGDTEAVFWMRNTPMPLSIAFVRADGSIVSFSDMEPCADVPDCPSYPPQGPYRFAVEVPQGRFGNLRIGPSTLLGVDF